METGIIKDGKIDLLNLINRLSKEEQLELGKKILELINEAKKETPVAGTTDVTIMLDGKPI